MAAVSAAAARRGKRARATATGLRPLYSLTVGSVGRGGHVVRQARQARSPAPRWLALSGRAMHGVKSPHELTELTESDFGPRRPPHRHSMLLSTLSRRCRRPCSAQAAGLQRWRTNRS